MEIDELWLNSSKPLHCKDTRCLENIVTLNNVFQGHQYSIT